MAEIPAKLQELLDTFEMYPDRAQRMELLLDMADRFEEVPERVATRPFPEEHRTPACESEAFVWAEPLPEGNLKFWFAVENPQGISAKALAAILDRALSGQPLEQVAAVPQDVVYRFFGRDLSMGKGMGLMGMVAMVTRAARRCLERDG